MIKPHIVNVFGYNTTRSNGVIRLSENRTSYIPPSKSLTLGAGVVLDAAGHLPSGFILLDANSTLALDVNSTFVANDVLTEEILSNTSVSITYDANDNMMSDGFLTFQYNDDNRLSKVYNGSNLLEEYLYGWVGENMVKSVLA
ncbi:MAG: hypothetical protein V1744_05085 [Candidatus Altiarchaeota archaeon]